MSPSPTSKPSTFMQSFINNTPISSTALTHFQQVSWTSSIRENPLYECIPTFSRVLKIGTGEDFFFSRTVNTPQTIEHQLTYRLRSLPIPRDDGLWKKSRDPKSKRPAVPPANPDIYILMRLGSPGMDGHPHTMHGGMLCAILDEMMGLCVMFHNDRDSVGKERQSIYTVQLDTTYRRPVETPSDVCVRCWVEESAGRKYVARGQVCDPRGEVMTEAKGVWVRTKERVGKL